MGSFIKREIQGTDKMRGLGLKKLHIGQSHGLRRQMQQNTTQTKTEMSTEPLLRGSIVRFCHSND